MGRHKSIPHEEKFEKLMFEPIVQPTTEAPSNNADIQVSVGSTTYYQSTENHDNLSFDKSIDSTIVNHAVLQSQIDDKSLDISTNNINEDLLVTTMPEESTQIACLQSVENDMRNDTLSTAALLEESQNHQSSTEHTDVTDTDYHRASQLFQSVTEYEADMKDESCSENNLAFESNIKEPNCIQSDSNLVKSIQSNNRESESPIEGNISIKAETDSTGGSVFPVSPSIGKRSRSKSSSKAEADSPEEKKLKTKSPGDGQWMETYLKVSKILTANPHVEIPKDTCVIDDATGKSINISKWLMRQRTPFLRHMKAENIDALVLLIVNCGLWNNDREVIEKVRLEYPDAVFSKPKDRGGGLRQTSLRDDLAVSKNGTSKISSSSSNSNSSNSSSSNSSSSSSSSRSSNLSHGKKQSQLSDGDKGPSLATSMSSTDSDSFINKRTKASPTRNADTKESDVSSPVRIRQMSQKSTPPDMCTHPSGKPAKSAGLSSTPLPTTAPAKMRRSELPLSAAKDSPHDKPKVSLRPVKQEGKSAREAGTKSFPWQISNPIIPTAPTAPSSSQPPSTFLPSQEAFIGFIQQESENENEIFFGIGKVFSVGDDKKSEVLLMRPYWGTAQHTSDVYLTSHLRIAHDEVRTVSHDEILLLDITFKSGGNFESFKSFRML